MGRWAALQARLAPLLAGLDGFSQLAQGSAPATQQQGLRAGVAQLAAAAATISQCARSRQDDDLERLVEQPVGRCACMLAGTWSEVMDGAVQWADVGDAFDVCGDGGR